MPASDMPLAKALRGEVVASHTLSMIRGSSSARTFFRIGAAPVFNADGQIVAAAYTAQDLTCALNIPSACCVASTGVMNGVGSGLLHVCHCCIPACTRHGIKCRPDASRSRARAQQRRHALALQRQPRAAVSRCLLCGGG